jgi:thiol oxidase
VRYTGMHGLLVVAAVLHASVAPPAANTPSCALYNDYPVGVVCFQGDDLTTAIATGGTGWLVEFYSSWCGHCQHFASTWKTLAEDVAGWSPVVKLGVIDCSSKQSYSTCTDYSIRGYPAMRFFQPGGDPETSTDNYHGSRKVEDIQEAIIDRLQSWEGPFSAKWPHFQLLE